MKKRIWKIEGNDRELQYYFFYIALSCRGQVPITSQIPKAEKVVY